MQDFIRHLEALKKLRSMGSNPEADHDEADKILLEFVPWEIAKEYKALVERSDWWACA